jgi:hypothetical protein
MSMRAERRECGSVSFRLLVGLVVLGLGLIYLAANLGLVDAERVLRSFWPAAFVAIGLVVLLQRRQGGRRLWGLAWILAGVWIYGHDRGWIRIEFWDLFLPLLLLAAGTSLVLRSLRGSAADAAGRRPRESDRGDFPRAVGVFSGNVLRSTSTDFRGAELTAVMGGVTLDLTEARMASDRATIDLIAFWGGIEVRVPSGWAVTSQVVPILGAFEDKTRPAGTAPTKQLLVRGVVVMGGVEVKS